MSDFSPLVWTAEDYLEDIYAGEVDENLPYDPDFDDIALSIKLVRSADVIAQQAISLIYK